MSVLFPEGNFIQLCSNELLVAVIVQFRAGVMGKNMLSDVRIHFP